MSVASMTRRAFTVAAAAACCRGEVEAASPAASAGDWPAAHARCRPVPLACVRPEGFLGRRIHANLKSLILGLDSPIPRGFEARAAGRQPGPETRRLAADSDLYKWIEGAAYTFALTRDERLGRELDRIAKLVNACQQADGYINTQVGPNRRFDPKVNHDLYIAGHFFEAAVAHQRATGSSLLLAAARRWADYLMSEAEHGNPYFETVAQREHSEYELGFLRLYRATGERKYLEFSGKLARLIPAGPELLSGRYAAGAHAVRVNYLLTAYGDLCLETGDEFYRRNLAGIWDDIAENRSFITGGVSIHERYRGAHELPQVTSHASRDIAETCTSISLIMWAWRMHALTADARYIDRIETILYNHFLGAVTLDNLGTFYYNPLRMLRETEGKTDHGGPVDHRTMLPAIHSTSCCITNEWRFFGALPEYLFSCDDTGLYVNLYTSGTVRHTLASGAETAFVVETDYPHVGLVKLRAANTKPSSFALRLRIPAWCRSASVRVPGAPPRRVEGGRYETIERTWKPGDTVVLEMDMPVRMLLPHPEEKENAGQAVLARGPLVYCLEQQDAAFPIQDARWDLKPEEAARRVKVRRRGDLLGGISVLLAPGVLSGTAARRVQLPLIPFYARANRGEHNRWTTFLPLSESAGAR